MPDGGQRKGKPQARDHKRSGRQCGARAWTTAGATYRGAHESKRNRRNNNLYLQGKQTLTVIGNDQHGKKGGKSAQ